MLDFQEATCSSSFSECFNDCKCKSIIVVNDKERFYVMEAENIFILLYDDNIDEVPLIRDMHYRLRIDNKTIVTKDDFEKVTYNYNFIEMFLNEYHDDEVKQYKGFKVDVDYSDSLTPDKPIKTLYLFPIFDEVEEED